MEEPVGAARSAGLLEIAQLSFTRDHGKRIPKSASTAARNVLKREIRKPRDAEIDSIDSVVRECGVSWASLKQGLSTEASEFHRRRKEWMAMRKELACASADKLLHGGLIAGYLSGSIATQDHVVEEVRVRAKVSLRMARQRLEVALASHESGVLSRRRALSTRNTRST
jgi:hypothetical protein